MPPTPPFPNFTSPHTFPIFSTLPLTSSPPSSSSTHDLSKPNFLLGTLKENMTLSTNPTYILGDSSGQNFACVLRKPTESGGPKFEVERFKKKHTLVLRDAERSGVKDGKQGHVAKGIEEVMMIPASVEKLMELSIRARAELVQREGEIKDGEEVCQACGKTGENLLRCRGCECVWYCDKNCQTKGWSEGGHKTDCKIFKAVAGMDLGDRGFNSSQED